MESSSYGLLINKLDRFIRKYYKNQLIKGVILCTSLVLLTWFTVVTLEYYGRFDTGVRTGLFYSFIAIAGFILAKWIFTPLFRLYKLGKSISHEQAAAIIGEHFEDIDDKLINTLQLKKQADASDVSQRSLIAASLDQRIENLSPVPFNKAIDFKENRKYLKFAIPPFLFLLGVIFINADILSDGSSRILNHTQYFEEELPFEFIIKNKDLSVVEQEDFQLEVRLKQKEAVPENIYLEIDGKRFRLDKENNINFSYIFRNVQEDKHFRLVGDDVYSREYALKTLPNPLILNFDVRLDYPSYTGKQDETLRNSGDMMIPAGTKVVWDFRTKNTESISLSFSDSSYQLSPTTANSYQFTQRFMRSKTYAVSTSNQYIQGRDSIAYRINVVPDAYPAISVDEKKDSTSNRRLFFMGDVSDDYGFKRLTFNYRYTGSSDSISKELQTEVLGLNKLGTQEQFYHAWDLTGMKIQPGDEIEYYFEVWDNDGVNGSKSTRSQKRIYKAPTLDEIAERTEANNEQIKNSLSESLSEANQLQQDLNKMQEDMLNKRNLNWQDRQKIEDLLKRQKELEKKIEDVQQQNEDNNEQKQEFTEMDKELLEKQKELQKLMDELMTDEMKKLYEELNELLEQMDKNKIQQKLDEMKMENKDLSKELDRSLELFKQMEFEQKLDEAIEKLEKLAEEQEELAEDTKNKEGTPEELKERQDELNEAFKKAREDLDKLEEKNAEMENPNTMPDTEEQEESIEQDMQESSEQLSQNKEKKASQSQQEAAEQMKKLAQQMQQMQQQNASEQAAEDMNALRALLENIVHLSFDQEDLMEELRTTGAKDPRYVDLGREQRKLKDDARIIEDSLFALSKRVPQLESTVNREISAINDNMAKSLDYIGERHTAHATSRQQYVMTSLNNLALLLDDALQQMQQQMANSMPGTGNCEKPGGSGSPKPGMGDMKKMQQALSKQIEEMKKQLEQQGNNPGGKKPGEQEGEGNMPMPGGKKPGQGPGMSEQLAKMAAQQEALRREMERLGEEMNKDGSHAGDGLKKIARDMEENERDLINRDITHETLMRQQEIMTKLLEHERAEREREKDNKREAQEAKNQEFSNPDEFLEYKRKKEQEVELLKTVPPTLRTYYKNKVNQYFNSFE